MEQFFLDLEEVRKFMCWINTSLGKIRESSMNWITPTNAVAMFRGIYRANVDWDRYIGQKLGLWDYQYWSIVMSCENYRENKYFNPALRRRVLDALKLTEINHK